MPLTDAQLKDLGSKLFLLQKPADTKLQKPRNTTGADDLDAKLKSIGSDRRFSDWGIGVVDFTKSVMLPKVWLHNGDDSWRVGSTGKIAILLAAFQLRDDVLTVQATKLLKKPEEYDDLFAMDKLWRMASDSRVRQIAGKDHAPRISTIFDFSKGDAAFTGAAPDTPDFNNVLDRLALTQGKQTFEAHLHWNEAIDYDFSERLWLMGAMSDNVAATSCLSEIGVAYVKAVQRAYGLFDEPKGMHLLLAGPYSPESPKTVVGNNTTLTYRPLQDIEMHDVKDALFNAASKKFEDQKSWEPGSAAALTAYMIAFIQQQLVGFGHGLGAGVVACELMKKYLSHGVPQRATHSYIALGVKGVTDITDQITKIGLLGKADGEPDPLNTEFAYLETKEKAAPHKVMKYGVVVTGIRSKPNTDGTPGPSATSLTKDLGVLIHQALL